MSLTNKQENHPILLKQLALEVINDTFPDVLTIYTNGSKFKDGRGRSDVFISNYERDNKFSTGSCDFCSVFRSEIIAVDKALEYAVTTNKCNIWILNVNRSAIQYLKNWAKIFEKPDQDVLVLLSGLGPSKSVCLQRIPSHVGV
ncbi:RNase H domain-containing protein [Trichonephila clavipes]|nr:RNase H domain-containing protein [Trichonephila clavipes]